MKLRTKLAAGLLVGAALTGLGAQAAQASDNYPTYQSCTASGFSAPVYSRILWMNTAGGNGADAKTLSWESSQQLNQGAATFGVFYTSNPGVVKFYGFNPNYLGYFADSGEPARYHYEQPLAYTTNPNWRDIDYATITVFKVGTTSPGCTSSPVHNPPNS